MSIDTATLALAISLISAGITFWNVNRQKNANEKNDIDKFKRELNLKTADEFIEVLFESKMVFNQIAAIKTDFKWHLSNTYTLDEFNEKIWAIIEADSKSLYKIEIQLKKREFILENYSATIRHIRDLYNQINTHAWDVKNKMLHGGHVDAAIRTHLSSIEKDASLIVEQIDIMISRVQHEFLGEIYRENL